MFEQTQYSNQIVSFVSVAVQIRHFCAHNVSDIENTSIFSLQIDTRVQSSRILDNGDNGGSYLH